MYGKLGKFNPERLKELGPKGATVDELHDAFLRQHSRRCEELEDL